MLHDPTSVASPALLEVMTMTSFSADASVPIPSVMPVPALSSPSSSLINVPIQELESHAFENTEQKLDQDKEEEEEKAKAVGLRWKGKRNQKRDRRVDHSPWPKIHIPTHLLKPSDPPPALDKTNPDLELDPRPHGEVGPRVDLQREHDVPSSQQQQEQQPLMASDGATVVMVANTPNSQPDVVIGDDVSTDHSVSESPVDAPSSLPSLSLSHFDQIQSDSSPGEASTTLDPEPVQHTVPTFHDKNASNFERIYVLDREDEDLVNLKYHYWGRVIGIVTATIVSATHGSVLSGYVLLDGHSDWIAKAVVGTICTYWITMTWAMNRVAGPLPY
ncbi:hypothetical protein BGX34_001309 [Mortierella sp. NVP85]|nr:hypothetical protein BGX34_001309 [Mortierella sp. NVP85]